MEQQDTGEGAAGSMVGFDIEFAFEQAIQHHETGQLPQAQALYLQILEIDAAHADSLHLLGLIEYQAGQKLIAADIIQRAIALNPKIAPYHNSLGNALRDLGHLREAADAFQEALRLRPSSPEINSNLGNALRDLGRPLDALDYYRAAVELRPDLPHLQYNLANIEAEIGDLGGAVASYQAALALNPDFADAHYNLGNALITLNWLSEAEKSFRAVLRLRPQDAGAYNNLGIALQEQGKPKEAERCYRDALKLNPDYAEAHYNLGCVLLAHSDLEAAAACYERATALKPDYGAAHIALCMSQLPVIYRDEAEIPQRRAAYQASLTALVENPNLHPSVMAEQIGTSQPFFLAYQGYHDRPLQKLYGAWACKMMAEACPPPALSSPPIAGEKIRIGIVSGFFHDHTVWKLFLKGWLKHIDRGRFEVFCYYTGTKQDVDTGTARASSDRFVQASQSGGFWRRTIQNDAPHVLLYPDIGMNPMSARLAAQRLAPVQCSTWGHPETSGFPTVDYFLSSALMEPPDGAEHYTERLILLPNLSTCFEPDERTPLDADRGAFGYRPSATVYWSGQALYKYLPQFDEIYARIALEVNDSQFVFIDFAKSRAVTAVFKDRLRSAFDRHGLDVERHCVFLPPLDQDHFIAAMGASDIVLDTIGWSGGRSTLDCLVHNPAIVTHAGPLMRGRHTAAILKRMGITDTTAKTIEDYVSIAVKLAAGEPWRRSIRNQVRSRKSNVYNDLTYIRGLEDFLVAAVQRGPA